MTDRERRFMVVQCSLRLGRLVLEEAVSIGVVVPELMGSYSQLMSGLEGLIFRVDREVEKCRGDEKREG